MTHSTTAKPKQRRIISRDELLARVPLSYPTIWRLMAAQRFPAARILADKRVGWFEDEVDAWLTNLPKAEYKQPVDTKSTALQGRAAPCLQPDEIGGSEPVARQCVCNKAKIKKRAPISRRFVNGKWVSADADTSMTHALLTAIKQKRGDA